MSKDAGRFLKIPSFFAVTKKLLGNSIRRLANVEYTFNLNTFFKRKYKCQYK